MSSLMKVIITTLLFFNFSCLLYSQNNNLSYPIVDTGQLDFYNNTGIIQSPSPGEKFYGQDAHYSGFEPSYTDNGDGTITDNVTGLMWQKSFIRIEWGEAESEAINASTGGYDDWRVPTIKELYSLILFTGNQGTGDPSSPTPPPDAEPFIDLDFFDFEYPTDSRYIDAQYVTNTVYTWTTMDGNPTFFGVNFADGRIKGYPQNLDNKLYYARFVRGNSTYGNNQLVDNEDNTITDEATGLMWTKIDSGNNIFSDLVSQFTKTDGSLNWEKALEMAENLEFAGFDDWRLPNAKELHSIVDYSRSPDATNSAAINPLFECSVIINEAGSSDYPAYWASTSFNPGSDAIVIYFGRALGYMQLPPGLDFYDVHGAGTQRTDPKTGDPSYGFGPQGDVRRVYNYIRFVREDENISQIGYENESIPDKIILEQNYPNPFNPTTNIKFSISGIETANKSISTKLTVYDLLAREVETLVDKNLSPGNYEIIFDASGLASGIYFYNLTADNFTQTKKMLLIR